MFTCKIRIRFNTSWPNSDKANSDILFKIQIRSLNFGPNDPINSKLLYKNTQKKVHKSYVFISVKSTSHSNLSDSFWSG